MQDGFVRTDKRVACIKNLFEKNTDFFSKSVPLAACSERVPFHPELGLCCTNRVRNQLFCFVAASRTSNFPFCHPYIVAVPLLLATWFF